MSQRISPQPAARGSQSANRLGRFSLSSHDFEELRLALRGWEARFAQLGAGPFSGRLQAAQAGSVQVVRVTANRVIQARGRLLPDRYAFSLITPANAGAIWRGRRLRPGQINVNQPGGAMDHLSADDYENWCLMVSAEELRRRAHGTLGVDAEALLSRTSILQVEIEVFRSLLLAARRLLGQAADARRPEGAASGGPEPGDACLPLLIKAAASGLQLPPPKLGSGVRSLIVRRAEEVMREAKQMPLLAERLSAEVGVCERTLRYAFMETYGLGPMAYFKRLRLNAARAALRARDVEPDSVAAVAASWGFKHLGNFAADYQKLFGELPSATLRRRLGR